MDEHLKLDNQLCFRLYSAARLTMGAYHRYLDALGITYPQYLVLIVLWEKDEQPVCDLCKRLMLETNTVTPLLQRMEKAGLVTRTRGKVDSRQRIVSLTDKGRALHEKASSIHDCLRSEITPQAGQEEDFRQMIPALDRLIKELQKLNK